MREQVTQFLNKVLAEDPSLFLIDLNITPDNQITVVLDGDTGVTVEDCMKVSRAIEHNLDREEIDFSLEVMSAGIFEPLDMPRQYKKNIGRDLKVKTETETIVGNLTEVTDNHITLEWKAREPKAVGKGKVTVIKKAELSYDIIKEAKVMVTFN